METEPEYRYAVHQKDLEGVQDILRGAKEHARWYSVVRFSNGIGHGLFQYKSIESFQMRVMLPRASWIMR